MHRSAALVVDGNPTTRMTLAGQLRGWLHLHQPGQPHRRCAARDRAPRLRPRGLQRRLPARRLRPGAAGRPAPQRAAAVRHGVHPHHRRGHLPESRRGAPSRRWTATWCAPTPPAACTTVSSRRSGARRRCGTSTARWKKAATTTPSSCACSALRPGGRSGCRPRAGAEILLRWAALARRRPVPIHLGHRAPPLGPAGRGALPARQRGHRGGTGHPAPFDRNRPRLPRRLRRARAGADGAGAVRGRARQPEQGAGDHPHGHRPPTAAGHAGVLSGQPGQGHRTAAACHLPGARLQDVRRRPGAAGHRRLRAPRPGGTRAPSRRAAQARPGQPRDARLRRFVQLVDLLAHASEHSADAIAPALATIGETVVAPDFDMEAACNLLAVLAALARHTALPTKRPWSPGWACAATSRPWASCSPTPPATTPGMPSAARVRSHHGAAHRTGAAPRQPRRAGAGAGGAVRRGAGNFNAPGRWRPPG